MVLPSGACRTDLGAPWACRSSRAQRVQPQPGLKMQVASGT